jgi:hypothetical protein
VQLRERGLAEHFGEDAGHSEVVLTWQETVSCATCGGSGFSGHESGYGDVCSECGGCRDAPGFWCRTMIDRLSVDRRRVIDVKTTERNAAPHAIGQLTGDWAIQTAMRRRSADVGARDRVARAVSRPGRGSFP